VGSIVLVCFCWLARGGSNHVRGMRLRGGLSPPTDTTLVNTTVLDVAGAAIVGVGGWYGGELVFSYAVGVAARKP